MPVINVCNHPVLMHKIALLRDAKQPPREFRRLLHELTLHVGYEASRNLTLQPKEVMTPTGTTAKCGVIKENIAILPILRAGLGMSEAMLELMPNAAVYHIGMYRLKGSPIPVCYYNRLPKDRCADVAFVLDPLIASGITLAATINELKMWGCKKIVVVAILSTQAGVDYLAKEHPDVILYVVDKSDTLTPDGKCVPGLGDAGDRQFSSPYEMEEAMGEKRAAEDEAADSPAKKAGKGEK